MATQPSNDDALPPRHQLIADRFLETGDYDLAGRAGGYSRGSAADRARQILNMPGVKAYVDAKKRKDDLAGVPIEDQNRRILNRLNEVLEGNVADFIKVDENGNPTLDFSAATREQMSALSNVKVKERKIYDRNGRVIGTERSGSFQMLDKLRAAEMLGKHTGLFKPEEHKIVMDVADRLLAARARVKAAQADTDDGDIIDGEVVGDE